MPSSASLPHVDTAELRKARGAFFTPSLITRFVTDWAIRTGGDRVLEPSAGDAAFMVEAVRRLQDLRFTDDPSPVVEGVEIHAHSAQLARCRVVEAGGDPRVEISDFFLVEPTAEYTAVIGNPPYIRYQDFTGESRNRSRKAALKAGVALSGLASSWAAFTVHSALFLKDGGRLGLVLPAELLSVNYASTVRRFLFDRFRNVELVLFEEQVFPEVEADVLLLLAEGFNEGPTDAAVIRQVRDAEDLLSGTVGQRWVPLDPAGKWTASLVDTEALEPLAGLRDSGAFAPLEAWGDTTLGMVTGNNGYFALSPARVRELGIPRRDLLGVPLHLKAATTTGVPALALDVWVSYELRRAGFDQDAVWPRPVHPRIMPRAVASLLAALPAKERVQLEQRLGKTSPMKGVVSSSANILGKNYLKQVDVVMSDWDTGPEVLISTKRMDSSFGKNAANRVEESYGDAKNLRLRHPLAALGFVYGLRSTILTEEPDKAEWIIDLLHKLGNEDDAYHAVGLLMIEYGDEVAPAEGDDVADEGDNALAEAGVVPEDEQSTAGPEQIDPDLVGDILDRLPKVSLLFDERAEEIHPARFLATMVRRVIEATPVNRHKEARRRMKTAPLTPSDHPPEPEDRD